ncbi:MAG: SDR family NAD(P)-dependent oxidoreductase [Proteobacteria bacterium]|nr:SDR family NAD(P)-dependent oxidoreductase [Pseudomonadota bacterium]
MEIKNQSVIVTGAASGMGAATAHYLAEQGAKVALFDRDYSNAKKVADEIHGIAIECDVTDPSSVEQAIAKSKEAQGPARICINCAGIVFGKRMVGKQGAMPLEEFNKVIQVNLIGTFNVMRLAAAHMIPLEPMGENGERGIIINTASIAAYEGQIGQTAYSASKGGIVSMTLPAARELAQFGIRVNTIAPGLIATPMLLNMPEEVQTSLVNSTVYPKRLGQPKEFAMLAAHIIQNTLINGEVIRLDGAVRLGVS